MTGKIDSVSDRAGVGELQSLRELIEREAWDPAASMCVGLVKAYPSDPVVWSHLSLVSLKLGHLSLAVSSALRAVQAQPTAVRFLQLAEAYWAAREFIQAQRALDYAEQYGAADKAQFDLASLCQLATLRFQLGQVSSAKKGYEAILSRDPGFLPATFNLAALLRFLGSFDESERLYRQVLNEEPGDFESVYNLVQLRRFQNDADVWDLLNQARERNDNSAEALFYLGYTAAKVYEDQGQYVKAFAEYQQAATIKRQHINYDLQRDLQLMAWLPTRFSAETVPLACELDKKRVVGPQPLFIVGLPRTGTTLVERILASHSKIVSGGELTSWPQALLESAGLDATRDPMALSTDQLSVIDDSQLASLGQRYHELSRQMLAVGETPDADIDQSQWWIDKLPLNSVYAGWLARALPSAKLVYVKRDPMDAAFSIFKMLFKHGYGYSYNLEELADYMVAHYWLMESWLEQFPHRFYCLSYEKLVSDTEAEIDRLIDFCELSAEPACHQFFENPSASLTASASQIREPVYRSSVGKWRRVEEQMKPVYDVFAAAGLV